MSEGDNRATLALRFRAMPTALVVGAGIGGLAAGIALRRSGWDVRVFERAQEPREVGFGVGLAPNAMAALRELGVADAIVDHGVIPTSAEIRRTDGTVLRHLAGQLDPARVGNMPRIVLRPVLHGALLQALRSHGVTVEGNRTAVRFEQDHARVRLHLADGTSAEGDILVGADGVGSTIRAQLHPDEPPASPSGYLGIRGLSRALDRMTGLQAIWYLGPGLESGVVQAGRSEIYWFVSLLADDANVEWPDVTSVLRRCTINNFDAQFHAITGATAPDDLRIDELLSRKPLARWGEGRVTILGDAAHPVLPHTGQGAAQALEDAAGLGRAMSRSADHVTALRKYEDVRARHTRKVVNMGPRIARTTTTRSPIVGWLRNTAIRLVPARLIVSILRRPGRTRIATCDRGARGTAIPGDSV